MQMLLGPRQHLQNGGFTVRINEDARKCVVFFGVPSPNAKPDSDGERWHYGGTGFLVTHTEGPLHFQYLVTCAHAAKELENWSDTGFVIRANLKDGKSHPITIDHAKWFYHPDTTVDVAVSPIGFDDKIYDVQWVNTLGFKRQTPLGVMCGDIISIVGLFRLRVGTKKNIPIVHTGTIASLSDPSEKIPIERGENFIETEAYLVEAQSLEGLSGSPVFIHQTVGLVFPNSKLPGGTYPTGFGPAHVLGMYIGAWDAEPGKILSKDRGIDGKYRVPVGVGLVVPSEKIIEVIENHPELKMQREEELKRFQKSKAAKADSSFPAREKEAGNPNHKEDFTALLDAAARKQK
jgi:hypothetical protein